MLQLSSFWNWWRTEIDLRISLKNKRVGLLIILKKERFAHAFGRDLINDGWDFDLISKCARRVKWRSIEKRKGKRRANGTDR